MGYIYIIQNNFNNKVYIGQTTKTIEERYKQHLSCKDNSAIHQSMRKHGIENFYVSKIEECPNEKLNEREVYWIKYYNSYKNGYNMTEGGQVNGIVETCKKYWDAHPDERHERAIKAGEGAKIVNQKRIYCLEFNTYYENAKIASSLTNVDYTSICDTACGKASSAGSHPISKEKLHWTYVTEEEYILNNRAKWIRNHPEDKYSCFKKENLVNKPVYCQELNKAFESARSSGYTKVDKVCNGIRKSAGKHSITQEKLHWKYITWKEYYDYLIQRSLNYES